jgi:hypothetical protein
MTIQQPPDDDIPSTPPTEDPEPTPIDTPTEPEQRAPGQKQMPVGAPRDEPDASLS